jgi:hypothetical protein
MKANHLKALVIFHSPSGCQPPLFRSGRWHLFSVAQEKLVYQVVIPSGLFLKKYRPIHTYFARQSFDASFLLGERLINLSVLQPIGKKPPASYQNNRPYNYEERASRPVIIQKGCYKGIKRIYQLGGTAGILKRHQGRLSWRTEDLQNYAFIGPNACTPFGPKGQLGGGVDKKKGGG